MRLYVNPLGRWFGTQADAKAAGGKWRELDVPTDKPGLLAFLNVWHVAAQREDPTPVGQSAPPAPSPAYVGQSLALDENFDSLPLARQLHFAAVAMENARLALRAVPAD